MLDSSLEAFFFFIRLLEKTMGFEQESLYPRGSVMTKLTDAKVMVWGRDSLSLVCSIPSVGFHLPPKFPQNGF